MLNNQNENPVTDCTGDTRPKVRRGLLRRFCKEKSGTSTIEFALLALPFLIVLFASLETFAAFTAEQLLSNATDTMARKVRTGEITFGLNPATDMSEEQFRKAFCNEISIIMKCSETEAKKPSRLFIDVRSFADFSKIPVAIPRKGGSSGDLDTSGFKFSPGGPTTINIVRAYYRWEVITDLVRPYITNLRPAGSSMPNDYLMVSTAAFRNENY
ncbi:MULTISPECIES: TadE/TadG family type IV pilus assembly protein [unclassified Rhizobium]|uniref:TadE/TadG family type IV pilus assembly protein n=1 Tax=unclassified Rhizobium TaxID=2613769 RepID=UPI0007144CC5|nr:MULTISPECIES: TadE/TadG family type IV pilus assembly protein [unclassified Rhizobium]KQS87809.1 pilus assembly protein TadG [Rhizobium sp. Leaf386]KQS94634.1 pilus assembly protein TadG [Rhizobium sp. Leaf391]KQU01648.1 pilus assembly protein TadG [Rhizobium sp. Leaf453]